MLDCNPMLLVARLTQRLNQGSCIRARLGTALLEALVDRFMHDVGQCDPLFGERPRVTEALGTEAYVDQAGTHSL